MKKRSVMCSLMIVSLLLGSFLALAPMINTSYAEGADSLPSEYCMRDEYVVLAQNQDKHGLCWNFAATMAASTTIMKATGEYYDFSELWSAVSYSITNRYSPFGGGGGFGYQASAMKLSGLMLESDLPYEQSYVVSNENVTDYYNFYEKYSCDDLADCLVDDVRLSQSNVEQIKRHIYENGSAYLAFSFAQGFVECEEKKAEGKEVYYLPPNQNKWNSSHAVSVIGWDDNFEKELYVEGSDTPKVFKGAWIIMNSYTEKSGTDGLSFVFYDDTNISSVDGYRYEPNTSKELYFYDKIESGYAYPNNVKGKYCGDFTAMPGVTKQKNIFYDDVALEYSYTASEGADINDIRIYLDNLDVTSDFSVRVDSAAKKFYISKDDAEYGNYKVIVHYGNGEKSDTYLNNFFVTYGLFGEELEYNTDNTTFTFKPNRDIEFYSFIEAEKNFVIYTNKLSGSVSFVQTETSVYSDVNMSVPTISYEIMNGVSCTKIHTVTAANGYKLEYKFTFVYCSDTSMQQVNVFYDLGGGINNSNNYAKEMASTEDGLVLYAPTREGYTFGGWYLDHGNGSKKVEERDGLYYVKWEDIHHMGEDPSVRALSYYKEHYLNSNTLFVYAHWLEDEYHTVDINVSGTGTSQINEEILLRRGDRVKYFLKPASGSTVSSLSINGKALSSSEVVEIINRGLVITCADEDICIDVTFSEGVYLSLAGGENVKSVYVVGTYNGEQRRFYDGDFIPAVYFANTNSRYPIAIDPDQFPVIGPISPDIGPIIDPDRFSPDIDPIIDPDKFPVIGPIIDPLPDLNTKLPVDIIGKDVLSLAEDGSDKLQSYGTLIPSYTNATSFILVVELDESRPGYTYAPEGYTSYSAVGEGVFAKNISISKSAKATTYDVGSAVELEIEPVEITYSVDSRYILNHYISTDKNATSGKSGSLQCNAGDIVYLFVELRDDTAQYKYSAPDFFEKIGDRTYRKAIYASTEGARLGTIGAYRELQKYKVTWLNWDGSVIYVGECQYGRTPVFNRTYGGYGDKLVRPDTDEYSYIFDGWDKPLRAIYSDMTYTATYEDIPRRYTVSVETTENGTVTTSGIVAPGGYYINYYDIHTYVFTPEAGYKVKDVIVNGESKGAITSYTFSEIESDQTLRVEFEKIKYTVNVICGANGSADLTGPIEVEHGSGITVNATPAAGFALEYVKVNGVPINATSSFAVENVTADTLVEIAFKQVSFTVTTSASGGGSVTPTAFASLGQSVILDFIPKIGHKIKDVIVDGVSVGALDHYSFVGMDRDHTVSVEFEVDVWAIVFVSLTSLTLIGTTLLAVLVLRARRRASHITAPKGSVFGVDEDGDISDDDIVDIDGIEDLAKEDGIALDALTEDIPEDVPEVETAEYDAEEASGEQAIEDCTEDIPEEQVIEDIPEEQAIEDIPEEQAIEDIPEEDRSDETITEENGTKE